MFHSQIEIASPIFDALHQAREFFGERRQRLAQALADEGAGLYGAASHPRAQWLRQRPRGSPHYRQLFDDYQLVARRSLLNGLHVHVGVPVGIDRMRVINRVLYWLPLLLALSTSSTYWGGEDTGYMSTAAQCAGNGRTWGSQSRYRTGVPTSATGHCCNVPAAWPRTATSGGRSGPRGGFRRSSCVSAMAARGWRMPWLSPACFATWSSRRWPATMTPQPRDALGHPGELLARPASGPPGHLHRCPRATAGQRRGLADAVAAAVPG